MHDNARRRFHEHLAAAAPDGTRVLDLGARDVNGTVHDLVHDAMPGAVVRTLDLHPHPSVDIVADARTWTPDQAYDLVMSTELLEHVHEWWRVIPTAHAALTRGGWFIGTAASTGRNPHGAHGDAGLAPGEHYGNVPADELEHELREAGFGDIAVAYDPHPGDVSWRARKP